MLNLSDLNAGAWATIVVGIFTTAAQLISIFVVYVLGKSQGRAQTRHEEAARAMVEALRLTRQVATECSEWVRYRKGGIGKK